MRNFHHHCFFKRKGPLKLSDSSSVTYRSHKPKKQSTSRHVTPKKLECPGRHGGGSVVFEYQPEVDPIIPLDEVFFIGIIFGVQSYLTSAGIWKTRLGSVCWYTP